MKLTNIKVTEAFQKTNPNSTKLEACEKYYKKHNCLDKPITINKDGTLVDGYIRYLVAKKMKMEDVPTVDYEENHIYVQGQHSEGGKHYWWKVKKQHENGFLRKVNIGDMIKVDTRKGRCLVKVTDIKSDIFPPVDYKIRTVVKY